MTACFSKWRKLNPVTVPTNAKACANYLNGYLARKDGFNKGFDLGIMLDTNGLLAEASIEAVFIVKNGVLKVPPLGQVLKSISRHSIVQAIPYAGIPIIETAITKEDVLDADEVFAAHSIDRVMPIKQFGERRLAAPGPVTLKVINLIKDIFDYKIEKFMDWFLPLK